MADVSLDLSTLRMVNTKERFERFANLIPEGTINKESRAILRRMGEFFKEVDVDYLTYETFWPFLRTKYPNWKEKDIALWSALVKPIEKHNPPGMDEAVTENLLTTELTNKLLALIAKYQEGDEIDLGPEVRSAQEAFDAALIRKVKTPDVVADWEEMVKEDEDNSGLPWRLSAIAQCVRSLRPGDFGIMAMRPGRGKTTLMASEVTHMALFLKDYYKGEFRPLVWFNNEGPGNRIMYRLRQALLGMSSREIRELGWQESRAKFIEMLHGDENWIQVVDIHGFTNFDVEEVIRKKNPGLVVFDMIDNIRFSGLGANGSERTDQKLEAMYQWARECCVKYGFPAIAASQLSNDAEGLRIPLLGMLKDSKTGKQGACDFIICGGYDPSMPNSRWISLSKTKLNMEGCPQSPDVPVTIDVDRGRLLMPESE